jgi:hypothetical protein
MQRRDVGLAAIACCADLVAADARFNLRILQVEKESASEERFFQLIEDYDRVSIECVHAVDVFDANGDTNALAQSLTELARELEAFIAGS